MATLLEIKPRVFLHSQAGRPVGSNLCASCLGLLNDTQIRPGKKKFSLHREPQRCLSCLLTSAKKRPRDRWELCEFSHGVVFHSLKCNHFLSESEIRIAPWGVLTSKSSGLIPAFLMNEVLTMFTFPVIDYRFIMARNRDYKCLVPFLLECELLHIHTGLKFRPTASEKAKRPGSC